jgi:DNA-binding transcriptional LysR family regulator
VNTIQVNYFLAAAKFLNFTKASEHLHVTQPALSRQIAALEHEIGANLFIRIRNTVQLTEAGAILAGGLEEIMAKYDELVDKAVSASHGLSGTLNVATVVGQSITGIFSKTLLYLWRNNPELQVQVIYNNMSKHLEALKSGEVDMVILSEQDLAGAGPDVHSKPVRTGKSCLVVPASHPNANKEGATFEDFKDQTFILMSNTESAKIANLQRSLCKAIGYDTSDRIAPNIGTVAVWLESGAGVTTLNPWHMLSTSPNLKFLEMDELMEVHESVAWLDTNHNPAIDAFLSALDICMREEEQ